MEHTSYTNAVSDRDETSEVRSDLLRSERHFPRLMHAAGDGAEMRTLGSSPLFRSLPELHTERSPEARRALRPLSPPLTWE